MEDKVLFSPLGHTDPVSGEYEGSFLHILRLCRPRKAYIYLSRDIAERDKKDNRYELFAKRLCEKEGFECEIIKEKEKGSVRANDFEAFYQPFEEIVEKMAAENEGSEILVNVSSGTPQMKNACNLLCAVSKHKLVPVQVDSPISRQQPQDDFDTEKSWAGLEGVNPNRPATDRLRLVESHNLRARFTLEYIKILMGAYDYVGALELAKEIGDHLNPDGIRLLEAAAKRLAQDKSFTQTLDREEKEKMLLRGDESARSIYEYLLYLGVRRERGELMEFLRGLSPVLTDLYYAYLKIVCKIDAKENFCDYDEKNKLYQMKAQKLRDYDPKLLDHCEGALNSAFRDSDLSGNNLSFLIGYYSEDEDLKTNVRRLQAYERNLRNKAAHEIVCVNEKWIEENGTARSKRDRKLYPQASVFILMLMQSIFEKTYPNSQPDWEGYPKMNRLIEEKLTMLGK